MDSAKSLYNTCAIAATGSNDIPLLEEFAVTNNDVIGDSANGQKESQKRRRRASKACYGCRKRKTKCHIEGFQNSCIRCNQEGIVCEVPLVEKRGGYGNVLAGKRRRFKEKQVKSLGGSQNYYNTLMAPDTDPQNENDYYISENNDQMQSEQFEGDATDINSESENNINYNNSLLRKDYPHLPGNEGSDSNHPGFSSSPDHFIQPITINNLTQGNKHQHQYQPEPESLLKKEIYNSGDAIEILTYEAQRRKTHHILLNAPLNQASKEGSIPTKVLTDCNHSRYHQLRSNERARDRSIKQTSSAGTCDRGSFEIINRRVSVFDAAIVIDGILTVEEACKFVSCFFKDFSPFYEAYIPIEYQELARISAEPALMAVVCTIGARCLEGREHYNLHEKLWNYCKLTLSSMLWECASHHARSLVFAVLIFSEWFPRAFLQRVDLPGVTLQRHTRICWPLMGQAVRVANYVGLLKADIQTNIALHFTDHLLACRLGETPMLNYSEKVDQEFSDKLLSNCRQIDRARLDIVRLLSIAKRSLYRSRSETRKLLASGQYMPILGLIYQLVSKWKTDYREIVENDTWEKQSVMFELCHFELYVFSIILIPWQKNVTGNMLFELEESQNYLDIATQAAHFIIAHESSKDIPVKLKNSPIQWITRLMHAAVFLAKVLISLPAPKNIQQQMVHSISLASKTMAKLPPDDEQLYAQSLESVCRQFRQDSPTSEKEKRTTKLQDHLRSKKNTAHCIVPGTQANNLTINMPTLSPKLYPFSTATEQHLNQERRPTSQSASPLTDDGNDLDISLDESSEHIWEFLLDHDIHSYLANESPTYSDDRNRK